MITITGLTLGVLTLLNCGGIIDVVSPRDPVLNAASSGDAAKLRTLVKDEGRDINYKDASGEGAFHHAARWCKDRVISVISELGGKIDMRSKNNDQALHIAASKGWCSKTINELVKAGADVNSLGSENEAPLHKAAKTEALDSVEALLSNGASKTLKNGSGQTALEIAQKYLDEKQESLKKAPEEYARCLKENPNDKNLCSDHSSVYKASIEHLNKIIKLLQ